MGVAALLAGPDRALGQPTPPAQTQPSGDALRPAIPQLLIRAAGAASWTDGQTNIVLLRGGVELQAGEATLQAPDAILWLEKLPGEARTRADVVLLGTDEQNAIVQTPEARQFGERLAANVIVDGVRFDVPVREARDMSASEIYQRALPLRPRPAPTTGPAAGPVQPGSATQPGTVVPIEAPAVERTVAPVRLTAADVRTTPSADGTIALLATGGVFLSQRADNGDPLELRADRAVVFTALERLDEGALQADALREKITGVYLEGDVRIVYTPGGGDREGFTAVEQRLEAARAFYDFETERAVLTRAVLHTTAPEASGALRAREPITLRADTIRQLARGRYEADNAEISTSRFAVPDYSLNASRVFVRREEGRSVFGADNVNARLFDVPFFWFPSVRGSTVDNRLPLRRVSVGDSKDFGFGVETTWGLFETFNTTPPRTLDATYTLGHLGDRGFTAGLDADYYGDIFLFGNRPETFSGELTAFLVDDHGFDNLGRERASIEQDDLRGRFFWQHLHYFPGDWSAQARVGFASDETFLEQWERRQFWEGPPHDLFFNVDRASGNELLGMGVVYDINDFATTSNEFQEGASIERLPEARYARFGDRLGPVTLTSRNRVGLLQFNNFQPDLVADLGFRDFGSPDVDESFPGIPAYGYTGTPEKLIGRGDFRQELSLPLEMDGVSVVPFLVGRFTAYSDHLNGGAVGRALGGAGLRVGTAFSRTDDRIYSRILDIDRVRHVIEPSVTGFTSWQSEDANDLYIFDQGIDTISDVTAVQLAMRQRWQTKRGGPGRKRSVDFLTWGIEANFFEDEPDELFVPTNAGFATAAGFRGLFFASEPESSLPRDGINTDALWRISDTTALVGDAAYSLESDDLVTLAAGVIITRDDRLSYSIGGRYVEPLDLLLGVGSIDYRLSQRYSLAAAASYDVEISDIRHTSVMVTRRFDRFLINVGVYTDRIDDDSGIRFMIAPIGFRDLSLSSNQLEERR